MYYDGQCSLCLHIQSWLASESPIIPILFVDRSSEDARTVYASTEGLRGHWDLVVLDDTGNL